MLSGLDLNILRNSEFIEFTYIANKIEEIEQGNPDLHGTLSDLLDLVVASVINIEENIDGLRDQAYDEGYSVGFFEADSQAEYAIDMARDEGYQEGYESGFEDGYDKGTMEAEEE